MRHGREFWKRAAAEVDGGERITDVARRHRVRPRTLTWWRWKLRSEGSAKPMLLPVIVRRAEFERKAAMIELRVRDVVLSVATGSDVKYIAALVDALRS